MKLKNQSYVDSCASARDAITDQVLAGREQGLGIKRLAKLHGFAPNTIKRILIEHDAYYDTREEDYKPSEWLYRRWI